MERFHDRATADIYHGRRTPGARRALPVFLHGVAQRKLDMVLAATNLLDLRFPPGNGLESLKGGRKGQHSIRIDSQYRICFIWTKEGADRIEITDYH